jgi:penicillin-binding protein 1A
MLMSGLSDPGGTSSRLRNYIDRFRDTDFGGKTGTTNNHSDAWYEAVTPNLVVGAWVGGEYRCIHFKTGASAQGSRTSLPICGTFLKSVLSDPRFKKYHAKFPKSEEEDITRSMYTCASYYKAPAAKKTATKSDSISSPSDEEIQFDENGNPITEPTNGNTSGENGTNNSSNNNNKGTKRHQSEEPVNLNNL